MCDDSFEYPVSRLVHNHRETVSTIQFDSSSKDLQSPDRYLTMWELFEHRGRVITVLVY
jgi:hypothetical protein